MILAEKKALGPLFRDSVSSLSVYRSVATINVFTTSQICKPLLTGKSCFQSNMSSSIVPGRVNTSLAWVLLLLLSSQSLAFTPSILPKLRSPTHIYVNVATSILRDELENSGGSSGKKLSRPERKALERANKRANANHRKHNYADRSDTLQGRIAPVEGRYDLHSKRVSKLSKDSSAEEVVKAIKRAQNLHDVHDIRTVERFLLEEAPKSFAYGYFGSLLSRLAVAALHLNEQQVARRALLRRRQDYSSSVLPMESAAIIRGLLRVHNVTDALQVLDEELALPSLDTTDLMSDENKELVKHRALSLGSIASRHFFEGEYSLAVQACQLLADVGPVVRSAGLTADDVPMPWARIVQGAAQCEVGRREGKISTCEDADVELPCNLVYAVLNAMTTFPSANDDRTYEVLSNSLVRRVLFVTGAVDMSGCPDADRGEAVFIGRSNVGKSSLVNMVSSSEQRCC